MTEPKNNEWWLCERGGVKTVFLRKDDEWRSDENDTYDYCNVTPLFKMIEDKPSSCVAGTPKHTRTEYEKVTESIFDLRDEFERGELYFKYSQGIEVIKTEQMLLVQIERDGVHRKVEKVVDERQEFIDNAYYLAQSCGSYNADEIAGVMYDAGCRFIGANEEID